MPLPAGPAFAGVWIAFSLVQVSSRPWQCAVLRFRSVWVSGRSFLGVAPSVTPRPFVAPGSTSSTGPAALPLPRTERALPAQRRRRAAHGEISSHPRSQHPPPERRQTISDLGRCARARLHSPRPNSQPPTTAQLPAAREQRPDLRGRNWDRTSDPSLVRRNLAQKKILVKASHMACEVRFIGPLRVSKGLRMSARRNPLGPHWPPDRPHAPTRWGRPAASADVVTCARPCCGPATIGCRRWPEPTAAGCLVLFEPYRTHSSELFDSATGLATRVGAGGSSPTRSPGCGSAGSRCGKGCRIPGPRVRSSTPPTGIVLDYSVHQPTRSALLAPGIARIKKFLRRAPHGGRRPRLQGGEGRVPSQPRWSREARHPAQMQAPAPPSLARRDLQHSRSSRKLIKWRTARKGRI